MSVGAVADAGAVAGAARFDAQPVHSQRAASHGAGDERPRHLCITSDRLFYGSIRIATVVPRTPTIADGASSRTASGASLAMRPET